MSNSQPVTMDQIMEQLRLLSEQEGMDGILMVDDEGSNQAEQLPLDKSLTENAEDPEFTIVENVTEVIDPSYSRSNITNDIPDMDEASEGTESIALDLGSASETEEKDTGDDDDALIQSEEAQKMWDALKAMENADSDSTIQNIRNILNSPATQPPEIVNLVEQAEDDEPSAKSQEIDLDLGQPDLMEDAQDKAKDVNDEIAGYLRQLEEINEAEPSEEYSQQPEILDLSLLSNSTPEKRQLWKDLSSMMALSSSTLAEEDDDDDNDDEEEDQDDDEEEGEDEDEEEEEEEEEGKQEVEIDIEDQDDVESAPQLVETEEIEVALEPQPVEEAIMTAPEPQPQITVEEIMAASDPMPLPSDFFVERMNLAKSQSEDLKEEGYDDEHIANSIELDIGADEEEMALDNLIDNISTRDLYEDANDAEELVPTPEIRVPPVSEIFIRKPLPQMDPSPYSQPVPSDMPKATIPMESATPRESLVQTMTNQGMFSSTVPVDLSKPNKAIDVFPYELSLLKIKINDALKTKRTTPSRLANRFNTVLDKTIFQPTDVQSMFNAMNQLSVRQFKQLEKLDIYNDTPQTSLRASSAPSPRLVSNLTYTPSRFQPSHSLLRSARQPSLFAKK